MLSQFSIFMLSATGAIVSEYFMSSILFLILAASAALYLMYEIQSGEHLCHRPVDPGPDWECPKCHLTWTHSGDLWRVRQ